MACGEGFKSPHNLTIAPRAKYPVDEAALNSLLIRHSLAAESLNQALAQKIVRLLNSADADLLGTLASRYALIEKKGRDTGPATTKRLEDLLSGIRKINTDVYQKVAKGVTVDLIDLAKHEAEFTAKAAGKAGVVFNKTALPSAQFLETLVTRTPIPVDQHGAALLKPWVEGMEANRFRRLEGAIRVGLVNGEATDDLVKRIRGTKEAEYSDGILNVSRQSAQTFAITANSSVQNAAREETFRAMKTIGYVEWSSILDTRTSSICQSRSGTIYAINEPHPAPPAHPRCRSLLLPRRNNTDPAKHKPFGEWLREQPDDVHDEVLGPERAAIFRANPNADFGKFFRPNGSYRTVDELRKFDEKMFAKAEAPKAPAPAKAPKPEAPKVFSPVNEKVTAESIKVEPKRASTKALSETLARNATDARYDPYPEFKGVKATDFGKAALGSLSDEASSMVRALMPELDTIADTFNVPRLRAIKISAKSIAAMGDGTLHLNPIYFNGYAAELASGGGDLTATLVARRDKLLSDYKALNDRLRDQRNAIAGLTGVEREKAMHAYLDGVDEITGVRKEYEKVRKQVEKSARTDASAKIEEGTTWKPGDDVAKRPRVSSDYFGKPIERARATLYHELFHHVHQMTGKKGRRALQKLPVEQEIKQLFFNKFHGAAPGNLQGRGLERKKLIATSYGASDPLEWACENFALFCMGRFDLVEDEMRELFERLIKEAKQ